MTYSSLFEFSDTGLFAFKRALMGLLPEEAVDLGDPDITKPILGTGALEVGPFETAKDLAASVLKALGSLEARQMVARQGLWAWLTFVLRDTLFPRNALGRRKTGELHRWYPSDPNDWLKAQRHLVRMPVLLLHQLGDLADHLLCGHPGVLPEIREQLTSQQDMFHPSFQRAARELYYDEARSRLKRGAGGKGGGSPRRLAKVRSQFDVTWDLYDLSSDRFVGLLPREFDKFRSVF